MDVSASIGHKTQSPGKAPRHLAASTQGTTGSGFVSGASSDVNGDGKADAIAVNSDGIAVHVSTGSYFSNTNPTHRWTIGGFSGSIGTYFADVNGDGKADAIAVNSDGIAVHVSTGSYFSDANLTQHWTAGGFYGSIGTYFGDVNGDGKADAIAVNTNGISVHLSTGSYFAIPNSPSSRATLGGFYGTVGTFFADANGDGRADAIAVNENNIAVELSTGITFSGSKGGTTAPPYWTQSGFFGDVGTFFADLNGDGRADAIAVNSDGIAVRLSEGWNFVSANPSFRWTVGGFWGTIGTFLGSQPRASG